MTITDLTPSSRAQTAAEIRTELDAQRHRDFVAGLDSEREFLDRLPALACAHELAAPLVAALDALCDLEERVSATVKLLEHWEFRPVTAEDLAEARSLLSTLHEIADLAAAGLHCGVSHRDQSPTGPAAMRTAINTLTDVESLAYAVTKGLRGYADESWPEAIEGGES